MEIKELKCLFCILISVTVTGILSHIFKVPSSRNLPYGTGYKTKTIEGLVNTAAKLARLSRYTDSPQELKIINSAFMEVSGLLDVILSSEKTGNCSQTMSDQSDSTSELTSADGCLNLSELPALVTVVFNFAYFSPPHKHIDKLLSDLSTAYPGVTLLVGSSQSHSLGRHDHAKIVRYNIHSYSESDVWNSLISHVRTPYVYVARDVMHVSQEIQLRSLIDSLLHSKASVAASAIRTINNGQWTAGCHQSALVNFTLVYKDGYDLSVGSCMVCNYVSGPFLSHKQLLLEVKLAEGMNSVGAFAQWFQELSHRKRIVLSCPESMAYLDDERFNLPQRREEWLQLVKHSQIELIYLADGTQFMFSCDEAQTYCNMVQPPGLARSHCCLRELSTALRIILRDCKASGIACQICDGTILGAAKMGSILPWEIDADITLEPGNFSAFKDIVAPGIIEKGYKFEYVAEDRCYRFYTSAWFVEMFQTATPDTRLMQDHGLIPTTILLDGEYVQAPESPGLHARNRYGAEIYQHANHWRTNGAEHSFIFYSAGLFAACPTPGSHACLDQFVADGNLHFAKPYV